MCVLCAPELTKVTLLSTSHQYWRVLSCREVSLLWRHNRFYVMIDMTSWDVRVWLVVSVLTKIKVNTKQSRQNRKRLSEIQSNVFILQSRLFSVTVWYIYECILRCVNWKLLVDYTTGLLNMKAVCLLLYSIFVKFLLLEKLLQNCNILMFR